VVKAGPAGADNSNVSRVLLTVVLVAALAASGGVFYKHVRREGIHSVLKSLNFRASGGQVAADELLAAATVLDQDHNALHTYTHTDLTRFHDLTLAYASDTSYCVQVLKADHWYHLVGPAGVPADGSC
jgi:hypothetical protein